MLTFERAHKAIAIGVITNLAGRLMLINMPILQSLHVVVNGVMASAIGMMQQNGTR